MNVGSVKAIEETLIRDVLGWTIADAPGSGERYPLVYWSPAERCFKLQRSPDEPARRFSPTRCLRDCWEVRRAVGDDRFCARLARPVWDGNVRVVCDCGTKEVVVEARSLPWTLSVAIYRAASEGLM